MMDEALDILARAMFEIVERESAGDNLRDTFINGLSEDRLRPHYNELTMFEKFACSSRAKTLAEDHVRLRPVRRRRAWSGSKPRKIWRSVDAGDHMATGFCLLDRRGQIERMGLLRRRCTTRAKSAIGSLCDPIAVVNLPLKQTDREITHEDRIIQ